MTDKTTLQTALQDAYEAIFNEKILPLSTGGKDFPIRLDDLSDRQAVAFLRYGKRALNDAYNSEAKACRDASKTPPNPQDFFDEWLKAWGTNKPRAGGARLSPELAGWIEYFKSADGKKIAQFKGETPNSKNIDKYQTVFVRKAIWPSVKEYLKKLPEEEQRAFHKEKLPALLEQHKQVVIAKAQDDLRTGQPGDFITQERKKREGTTEETFTVKIDIS